MKLRYVGFILGAIVWFAAMAGVSQARGLNPRDVSAPDATCTWNGTLGNWNESAKWNNCGGSFPGASDTAIVSSGTITLTADVTVNTLTFSGGTIQGSSNLVATNMTWTSGTFAGSGSTTVNGTLDMSNSSVTLDGRTFNNAGSATFGGSSTYMVLINGAVFNNQAGASLQFSHTSTGQVTYSTGGGTFNNSGFITKTFGSSNFTYIYAPFNNSNSVLVSGGTLSFGPASSTTSNHSGLLHVSTGATVQFAGSGTINFTGALTSTGTIQFTSGTLNFNSGTYSMTNTTVNGGTVLVAPGVSFSPLNVTLSYGTLNLSTGNPMSFNSLTMSGGTLTGLDNLTIGSMTWTGGTLAGASTNATVTGLLDMSNSSVTLDGRTFNNAGLATFGGSSTYMTLLNGAVFNNQAGASLQFSHTSTGQITYSTGGGTFNNNGVITKTASSTGFTYFYVPFNNGGSVTANAGTLQFNSPGSTTSNNSGTFRVSSGTTIQFTGSGTVNFTGAFTGTGTTQFTGGTLNFNSGTYNVTNTRVDGGAVSFASGASFSSPNTTISYGTLTLSTGNPINFNSLTMSGGTLTGSDNFTIGAMTWSGGTLSGASTNATVTGSLDMSNSSVVLDGRTLNNAGTATLGGSSVYMSLYNGAVFNNQSGASLQLTHTGTGQITYSTSGTFNNSGVITKPLTSNGFTYIYATFNNSGSFTIDGGTVYFAPNTGATNNDSGPMRVAAGAAVQFAGSGTQDFNSGSSLSGAGSVSFQSLNVNFNAGSTYAISNTQVNGGTADFVNASAVTFDDLTLGYGTLRIGDISVTGDFTRTYGTFTAISGTVTFKGGVTQNLALSSPTTFNNLAVNAGTTLVDTADANNAIVSGSLTNQGTIRKSKTISGASLYDFGLAGATISVTVRGSLSGATIDFVGQTHPAATGAIAPGRYWSISPSGGGYTVSLTLLQSLASPGQAKVCRFDVFLLDWACDKTSFTSNTVTLAGITDLGSSWAIGGAGRQVYLPLVIR